MYPNFYYIFQDWFGVNWPHLKLINSFGFFVAVSFMLGFYIMSIEIKRKYKLGILGEGKILKQTVGNPFPIGEYVSSGITGFIIGFKIIPMLSDFSVIENDPQKYILSTQGSFVWGIVVAAAFLGYNYFLDRKQRLAEPKEESHKVDPSYHMGAITMAAFIGGLLGSKLFHILENLSQFKADPWDSIMSFSGLTFFGGLIVGGASVLFVAKRKGLKLLHMLDVSAPAMMIAYGCGRIGCHISGDGDWGIVNTSPKPSWMSTLPDWLWSYNYPNNVNKVCNPFVEGDQQYLANSFCNFETTPYLVSPVFPTPLYEIIMCIVLFAILWFLRKRLKFAGILFGIYLIFSGIERFLIEKIRVNTIVKFGMTQSEIISIILFFLGILLIIYSYKRKLPLTLKKEIGTPIES